jgi:hypothetical protein
MSRRRPLVIARVVRELYRRGGGRKAAVVVPVEALPAVRSALADWTIQGAHERFIRAVGNVTSGDWERATRKAAHREP